MDDRSSQCLEIGVEVTNVGSYDGAEVIQVYVSAPETSSVGRPVKELKGFAKLYLKSGQTGHAVVKLSKKHAMSFWDEQANAWCLEKGTYTILVGNSSVFTPLSTIVDVVETTWWRGMW